MSQPRFKVYSMTHCPYCVRAKALLKDRGLAFQETVLEEDDDASWSALTARTGMKTVPQIFVTEDNGSERLIGGYTELAALDQQGGLKPYQT